MTPHSRHSRLPVATRLLAGLAALFMVLLGSLVPLSAAPASGSASMDGHACCEQEEPATEDHCTHASTSTADANRPAHPCECHLRPDDADTPGETVALTNSTIAFGPAVASQNSLQVDIPLAREPDEPRPARHLDFKPATGPLYLLNSVLLI